jgi:hypothetical protein
VLQDGLPERLDEPSGYQFLGHVARHGEYCAVPAGLPTHTGPVDARGAQGPVLQSPQRALDIGCINSGPATPVLNVENCPCVIPGSLHWSPQNVRPLPESIIC